MCPHSEVSESMGGLGPHLFTVTSTLKRDNKTEQAQGVFTDQWEGDNL